ncbi:hypothetical protein A9Q99_08105 [Gammaproteobacteria bacterium 45_16_T64]|nr:hypothetical protein A9Q99_08105 [Gammaproteobacteria bacterium 45_16_T64]
MRVVRNDRLVVCEKQATKSIKNKTPVFRLSSKSKKGKVFLSLKGFSQQKVVDVNNVAEMLNGLPVAHLEGLDEIRFFPEANKKIKAAYRATRKGPWFGRFFTSESRIELYRIESEVEFYWSLCHELGHFVMDRKLSASDKKQWVTELHNRLGAVSKYALTNAGEDFAESYACYLVDSTRLLESDPARYDFIKERVFQSKKNPAALAKNQKRKLDLTV